MTGHGSECFSSYVLVPSIRSLFSISSCFIHTIKIIIDFLVMHSVYLHVYTCFVKSHENIFGTHTIKLGTLS